MDDVEMQRGILARLLQGPATLSQLRYWLALDSKGHKSRAQLARRMQVLKRDDRIEYVYEQQGGPGWRLIESASEAPFLGQESKGVRLQDLRPGAKFRLSDVWTRGDDDTEGVGLIFCTYTDCISGQEAVDLSQDTRVFPI